MRTLEHRRHSRRDPGGIHLNAEGIALARKVGATLRAFDRVVTSPKPRAVETAEAMGLEVNATLPALGEIPADVAFPPEEFRPRTIDDFVNAVERSAVLGSYARNQLTLWRKELRKVPENGSLLMISHSGIVEAGAAAAVPREARAWGLPFDYLEGIRVVWNGSEWVSGEALRLSP
jgi:phosphohistidine phosphatase SixA